MKPKKNNHLWISINNLAWGSWSRVCSRPTFPLTLSDRCKLSFEADNIFDSKKSRVNSYYAGRSFAVKLDLQF
jgi:hypothetical protein